MCGIAGIIRWGNTDSLKREIGTMTRALAHRGPDGEGVFVDDNFALGHRRLSIIDLATGKQPMCNEDRSVWVTFNGEIYNFLELKECLEKKGHVFKSRSDTEVIIHGYEEWGTDCVLQLRGMFAFGIADVKNKKLFLARDHFGIKPLLYRVGKDYFGFASEHSALLEIEDKAPDIDFQSIDYYLRYQYIPTPHTIYATIFKLPPANIVEVSFDGSVGQPKRYWDLAFHPRRNFTEKEWLLRADEVIEESVRAHLVADVPFGVFLSGGIDSTLVASKMKKEMRGPVKAFSIGFDEESISELAYAKQAAGKYGIDLTTDIVTDLSLSMLPDLVRHYGEPFGDCSTIPTWYVSQLARQQVPMVLSGDGGDEGFGGYESYASWMMVDHFRQMGRMLSGFHLASAWGAFVRLLRTPPFRSQKYRFEDWQKHSMVCSGEALRYRLWKPDYHAFIPTPCALTDAVSKNAQAFDRLSYAQYMDCHTFLPCDILTKVDIASMYHGLEVRTPLVDVRVAELFMQLPESMRLRYDRNRWQGKYVLKKLLEPDFGTGFINRKKQGFAPPRKQLFYDGRPGQRMIFEILNDTSSKLNELFDVNVVRSLLESHGTARDNSGILWVFLVLGIWLDQSPKTYR